MPARGAMSVVLLLGTFHGHTKRKTLPGIKTTILMKLRTYSASVSPYIQSKCPPRKLETRLLLTTFIRYLVEENYKAPSYVLKISTPAPDITRIKDFIWWYIASATDQGRLSADKKLTIITTCVFAERFICGFKEATTSKIPEEDRSEIYSVCRVPSCDEFN
jgi:hypothetical protein